MTTQDRLEINWINTAGGALGAVSSAVVLSSLGAAGTLAGAAVGSLCISVGGSVYAHSMRKTKNRVAAVASGSGARKARAHEGELVTPAGEPVPPRVVEAPRQSPEKDGLPWKRIVVMAGALFAIALAVIVAFELSTGKPVSSYTGGSSGTSEGNTFSRVIDSQGGGGNDSQDNETDQKDQAPADEQQNEVPAQDEQAPAPAPEPEQEEAPAPAEQPQQEEAPAPAEQPQQEEAPAPAEQPQGAPESDE